ncbi:hypothetical protein GCK72_010674 [Caenorhabditis remanei]|uniref:Uncharacterized protein n=1 Tax=Caenorhabditis remanei TaxID=31234 RepID=A0A6A5H7P5_CAERE|nr:hypothetical protein GCK72_010674 [Caenorhabditis remanei]KAF1762412.1 hypothetical protein GCK72_010674 [Caenorhabditis remanei]
MSVPKKRKSDVHIDSCARDDSDHQTKKDKHWFEEAEQNGENRRGSIFKGIFKKMKSSASLKSSNKGTSSSKLETLANETQLSINSESSVTSVESGPSSLVPNIAKNAVLRTFVNRESFTPVPPSNEVEPTDPFLLPTVGGSKQESTSRMEDSISISSHMSVDTIGSNHTIDEDSVSIGSASAFCTPSRNSLQRNGLRASSRSVSGIDGDDDMPPALFRSLCNSAVRRVPNSKLLENGNNQMRRSMRMTIQKRNLSTKSMEDVPEEEEATGVISTAVIRMSAPIAEEECEEQFGGAKEFFDSNITSHDESADEGTASVSRLSTASESRASTGGTSLGRKSSIFRKFFNGKDKERRLSEVFHNAEPSTSTERRGSILSFTNDCSFAGGMPSASVSASVGNVSISSVASSESVQKPKMRKKNPSTSNLTQRLSSVFRRSSSTANKDDDFFCPSTQSTRRNTLTGYSSISSGIGSIASGVSDQGYGTIGSRNGHSISRNGSKRDDENKRERSRRLIDRIIISDIPASDLLKMKLEQIRRKDCDDSDEMFETQMKGSTSLNSFSQSEYLNFDVVAVDLKHDGTPFSSTAASYVDEKIIKMVKEDMHSNFRPDRCGSVTDCEPNLVYVQPEHPQILRGPNDSIASNSDPSSELLRNVRNGLHNSIEEWKKISSTRESSTMLIYPTFCQSEEEWDSQATIDAIFMMLDSILQNVRRWRPNGKCILAGLTPSNVSLLREKYDKLKESVEQTERDGPGSSFEDVDIQSISSTSTVFGKHM